METSMTVKGRKFECVYCETGMIGFEHGPIRMEPVGHLWAAWYKPDSRISGTARSPEMALDAMIVSLVEETRKMATMVEANSIAIEKIREALA